MKMAIFALRQAASFRNQSHLLYKAAIHKGWEAEERDISERADWPKESWDSIISLVPLWPRYIFESVRLCAPWLAKRFWLYGPVDGPYTQNEAFFMVMRNTMTVDRLATCSEYCRESMAKSGIHVRHVIHHGLDPDDFKFDKATRDERMKRLREQHPGRTIFFSNLNPIKRKGFDHLASAIQILSKKRAEDFIFVLHTGRDRALHHEPKLAKIPNLVIEDAYNQLPFRNIALKTMSCDVFVFPSLLEGFGLPVLEAMMSKRAIICADYPAMNELVDPKSAWMIPVTDVNTEKWEGPGCYAPMCHYEPSQLASCMEQAMDNPKECKEKAARAHNRSKNYHYLKVYEPFMKK